MNITRKPIKTAIVLCAGRLEVRSEVDVPELLGQENVLKCRTILDPRMVLKREPGALPPDEDSAARLGSLAQQILNEQKVAIERTWAHLEDGE